MSKTPQMKLLKAHEQDISCETPKAHEQDTSSEALKSS
jgi:hypothetical protein